jgi:Protein of unknown function (DUF2726)
MSVSGGSMVWGLLGLLAGLALGAYLLAVITRRIARNKRRLPKRWPLTARLVANTEERKVWRWLSGAFFEHSVMIKIPVTRFTMPRSQQQGLHWYELLSGVYCTFTVVTPGGQVIGCVDVNTRQRRSRSNYKLKETLLTQCGVAYMVVEPNHLPTLPEIRSEFLGELASMTRDHERDEAAIRVASTTLRASLMQQRKTRQSDRAPLSADGPDSRFGTSSRSFESSRRDARFLSSQLSDNSFIMPLDSRKGDLR